MADYRYYLGPWKWQADYGQPCWGPPHGCNAGIDLGTASQMDNPGHDRPLGFFWSQDKLGDEYTALGSGDCREVTTKGITRDAWEALTGFRPAGERLGDLLRDHLTRGTDPAGLDRAKPLIPDHAGRLELVLPEHGAIYSERVHPGHSHWGMIRDVVRRDLDRIREASTSGNVRTTKQATVNLEFHREALGGVVRKYHLGEDWRSWVPKGWDKGETPLRPGTTYTESFNGGDSTTLGVDQSWTEATNRWSNSGNRATLVGTSLTVAGLAYVTSALGSADNYAQMDIVTYNLTNNFILAAAARCDGASSHYAWRADAYSYNPDRRDIAKFTGTAATILSYNTGDVSIPVTWKLVCSGSTHTGHMDGVATLSVTDTTYTAGANVGIEGYAYGGDPTNKAEVDAFIGSDEVGQPAVKRMGGVPFAARNRGVW